MLHVPVAGDLLLSVWWRGGAYRRVQRFLWEGRGLTAALHLAELLMLVQNRWGTTQKTPRPPLDRSGELESLVFSHF